MHYVGTNCQPHERKGYRLLTSRSTNGVTFAKQDSPLLDIQESDDKHYSPCLRNWNGKSLLFYGLGSQGKYAIAVAQSHDGGRTFAAGSLPIIDVGPVHSAAVHTPKVLIANNRLSCYYTGSKISSKIFSKKYPQHDFGAGFRLFRSVSSDGQQFSAPEPIQIENTEFINLYGHNVLADGDTTYLTFTGFDGSTNRLYLSTSSDGIRFSKPVLLIEPDEKKSEVGAYSSSLLKLNNGRFRVYYGRRYFDNHWDIATRTFRIES